MPDTSELEKASDNILVAIECIQNDLKRQELSCQKELLVITLKLIEALDELTELREERRINFAT